MREQQAQPWVNHNALICCLPLRTHQILLT